MTMAAAVRTWSSILVTGADGFVGSRLLPPLLQVLPDAHVILAGRTMRSDETSRVTRIRLDITDAAAVDAVVAAYRPALVIHLAAQSSVGAAIGAGAMAWAVNHHGSYSLAVAMRTHVPEACLLFASSAEVYGRTFNFETATEQSDLRPISIYARTKSAAEAMMADVLPDSARLIIVRPSNHSGAGQDQRFVLPAFAAQVASIEAGLTPPVVRVGNLQAQRDFLHVDDVVAAYITLLAGSASLPMRATFNIASGNTVPVKALLDMVLARARVSVTVEQDAARMRASDVPVAALSAAALESATGWKPVRTLDDIVDDVFTEQRAHAAAASDA